MRGVGRAVELEADADHLDRAAVEHREVFAREAEETGDDDDGERERHLAHEVGALRRPIDERVDVLVDDIAHELALPGFHRLAAERLLHETAVEVVLRLVHLEDRMAEHLAHDVRVCGGGERLAVLQDLLHGLEAVRGEHADAAIDGHEVDVGTLGDDDRVVVALAFHRVLGTHQREHRVRVLDHAHSGAAVELLEGVVAVVDIRSDHGSTVLLCAPMALDQVNLGLLVLRVALGATMIAHGYNHIYRGGKIKGTAGWFASLGMNPGIFHAWLASITELAAGAALVVGLLTPLAAGALIGTLLVAFVTNHRKAGFFVFRRPTEGWEYIMNLVAALLAVACLGPGDWSLDNGINFAPHHWWSFVIALVIGVGGATATLVTFWRPPAPKPADS